MKYFEVKFLNTGAIKIVKGKNIFEASIFLEDGPRQTKEISENEFRKQKFLHAIDYAIERLEHVKNVTTSHSSPEAKHMIKDLLYEDLKLSDPKKEFDKWQKIIE